MGKRYTKNGNYLPIRCIVSACRYLDKYPNPYKSLELRSGSRPQGHRIMGCCSNPLFCKRYILKENPVKDALSGRIALVTGAGRGIGAAIARKLAAMGATTIICGRNRARLEQTASEIACESMVCDLTDWNSVA